MACAGLLTGCSLSGTSTGSAPAAGYQLGGFSGVVHGGIPPVSGATVKVYATQSITSPSSSNNYGYGQPGLLLAEANSVDGNQGDGNDTDATGSFTFSASNYVAACPAGQQVYLTASGGNTGAGANGNLLLMAALGSCDSLYNVTGSGKVYSGPGVWVDEVTTVAAAYSLANFMTITGTAAPYVVNISAPVANNFSDGVVAWNGSAYASCSGTACNGYASFNSTTGAETTYANGLAHAFTNAVNLVSLTTGTANSYIVSGAGATTKPSSGGYGVIPAALINTVANALQACVNSVGADISVSPVNTQTATASRPEIDTITLSSTSDTVYGKLAISAGTTGSPVTATISAAGGTTLAAFATQINGSSVGSYVSASVSGDVLTLTASHSGTAYALSFTGSALDDVYPSTDTSTNCGKLFNDMPSLSGTVPGNTLQAAVNLAKNPYSSAANVAAIQALPTAQTTVYTPSLTAAPADWSLSILYTGAGLAPTVVGTTSTLANPYNLALDANDSVYTNNTTNNSLVALSNNGTFLYGTSGVTAVNSAGTTLTTLRGLAADSAGNLFVPDDVTGNTSTSLAGTYEFNAATGAYEAELTHANGNPSTTLDPISAPLYVAVTRRNDVWVSYGVSGTGNVDWFQCTGSPCTYSYASVTGNKNSYSTGGFTEVTTLTDAFLEGIAVDSFQNVWIADQGYVSGSSNYTGTEVGILVNNYSATPATYPAYDNSTSAGSAAPYTNPKLLPVVSGCNTAPYTFAFDSSNNGWFTTTTTPPSTSSTTPTGALCKMTMTYSSSIATAATPSSSPISISTGGMPEALAIDGNNVLWIPIFSYNNSSTGYANYGVVAYNTTTGALQSQPTNGFTSCYVTPGTGTSCGTGSTTTGVYLGVAISNPRQAAIDSAGNLWLNEPDDGTITETLGIAAPTWPLLAAGKFGTVPY
jgi:hypothetical protein